MRYLRKMRKDIEHVWSVLPSHSRVPCTTCVGHLPSAINIAHSYQMLDDCREFADVLEAVSGDAGRVVAVTSADKAKAMNDKFPNFWDIKKIL